MFRISANHTHNAFSLDHFAVDTDFFDGWSNFHDLATCELRILTAERSFPWRGRKGSFQRLRDPLAEDGYNGRAFFLKYVPESHDHYRAGHEKSYLEALQSLPRPYESRLFHWP